MSTDDAGDETDIAAHLLRSGERPREAEARHREPKVVAARAGPPDLPPPLSPPSLASLAATVVVAAHHLVPSRGAITRPSPSPAVAPFVAVTAPKDAPSRRVARRIGIEGSLSISSTSEST